MSRKAKNNKRSIIMAAVLAALIFIGLLAVYLLEQAELKKEREAYVDDGYIPSARPVLTVDGRDYRMRDAVETYLIIGLDKFSTVKTDPLDYVNDQQSDFLLLLIADHDAETITALHINRDTMAEIQRYGLAGRKLKSFIGQLALSHTFGSGGRDSARYTAEAVSKLLYGVPMEHYSALMLDAVPALNDLVGGVSVYVEDDFGVASPELKQGTTVRLQGSQALTFIQARGSMQDKSNLNRMNRQRVYMQALYEQMTGQLKGDENFALRLATELSDYMISDLSVSELAELANMWKSYAFQGIETVAGEAVLGDVYIEFYHDADALLQQVLRLMFEPA